MSIDQHVVATPNFYPKARSLRQQYDRVFADPKNADRRRFCWDYWHVPDQYNFLRTPAWEFFDAKTYRDLHLSLIRYGQQELGCHSITPPWLSLYVEGASQGLHADVPHGPWAFVYSLTHWKNRPFTGGDTLILRPQTLDYWTNFRSRSGQESNRHNLTSNIPAHFNQLLVFDPRLPHGVNEVRGVKDPLAGRLVIHGWFTEPAPFVTGGLERSPGKSATAIQQAWDVIEKSHAPMADLMGVVVLKIFVDAPGRVSNVRVNMNTLKNGPANSVRMFVREIQSTFKKVQFPKMTKASVITLPIALT